MKKSTSRQPKLRFSRKGHRGALKAFADSAEKEAEFDQKTKVSWDEIEQFEKIELEDNRKVSKLLVHVRNGLRAYDYYLDRRRKERGLSLLWKAVSLIGPAILGQPEIQERVQQWWRARLRDEEAKKNWARFCQALGATGQGLLPKLTVEVRKEKRRAGNLQAKQDERAVRYFEKMLSQYKERTTLFPPEDHDRRRVVAGNIIDQQRVRGGVAKKEGIQLFLKEVKFDLQWRKRRTVSTKT